MNIEQMAREAGIKHPEMGVDGEDLERFAALHREALVQELVAVDVEPVAWQWLDTGTYRKNLPEHAEAGAWNALYTFDQLAGAVLRERERCCDVLLNKCHDDMTREEEAAAIREQT